MKLILLFVLCAIALPGCHVKSYDGSVVLNLDNFDSYVNGSDFAVVNFYASWCYYSKKFAPIYEQFAVEIREKYPESKLFVGKVDCNDEWELEEDFSIEMYPTIKLFRNGHLLKGNYKGKKSVDGLKNLINRFFERFH
jgi:thiol-disulfide isomerase/thioredoxin